MIYKYRMLYTKSQDRIVVQLFVREIFWKFFRYEYETSGYTKYGTEYKALYLEHLPEHFKSYEKSIIFSYGNLKPCEYFDSIDYKSVEFSNIQEVFELFPEYFI